MAHQSPGSNSAQYQSRPAGWETSHVERINRDLRRSVAMCACIAAAALLAQLLLRGWFCGVAALALICLFLVGILVDAHARRTILLELRTLGSPAPSPATARAAATPPAYAPTPEWPMPEWMARRAQERQRMPGNTVEP